MPDNLDATPAVDGAMTVMEMEPIRFERVDQFNVTPQLPVVVASHGNHLTTIGEVAQQLGSLSRRCLVMDEIAKNNQPLRLVFVHQLFQAVGDRRHSPQRNESAGRALAQFETEMEVRYGKPAFSSMEKREPAVEENFIGDERLVRA